MSNVVEQIYGALDSAKRFMNALKVSIWVLIGVIGAYAVNSVTPSQTDTPEIVEPMSAPAPDVVTPDVPEQEPDDVVKFGPGETKLPTEKPYVVYRCFFGWDWVSTIKVPARKVRIGGGGKPEYEFDVPGETIELKTPMENTWFDVVKKGAPPKEHEAREIIKARGEKLSPPREGGRYAGMVRVEVIDILK